MSEENLMKLGTWYGYRYHVLCLKWVDFCEAPPRNRPLILITPPFMIPKILSPQGLVRRHTAYRTFDWGDNGYACIVERKSAPIQALSCWCVRECANVYVDIAEHGS